MSYISFLESLKCSYTHTHTPPPLCSVLEESTFMFHMGRKHSSSQEHALMIPLIRQHFDLLVLSHYIHLYPEHTYHRHMLTFKYKLKEILFFIAMKQQKWLWEKMARFMANGKFIDLKLYTHNTIGMLLTCNYYL